MRPGHQEVEIAVVVVIAPLRRAVAHPGQISVDIDKAAVVIAVDVSFIGAAGAGIAAQEEVEIIVVVIIAPGEDAGGELGQVGVDVDKAAVVVAEDTAEGIYRRQTVALPGDRQVEIPVIVVIAPNPVAIAHPGQTGMDIGKEEGRGEEGGGVAGDRHRTVIGQHRPAVLFADDESPSWDCKTGIGDIRDIDIETVVEDAQAVGQRITVHIQRTLPAEEIGAVDHRQGVARARLQQVAGLRGVIYGSGGHLKVVAGDLPQPVGRFYRHRGAAEKVQRRVNIKIAAVQNRNDIRDGGRHRKAQGGAGIGIGEHLIEVGAGVHRAAVLRKTDIRDRIDDGDGIDLIRPDIREEGVAGIVVEVAVHFRQGHAQAVHLPALQVQVGDGDEGRIDRHRIEVHPARRLQAGNGGVADPIPGSQGAVDAEQVVVIGHRHCGGILHQVGEAVLGLEDIVDDPDIAAGAAGHMHRVDKTGGGVDAVVVDVAVAGAVGQLDHFGGIGGVVNKIIGDQMAADRAGAVVHPHRHVAEIEMIGNNMRSVHPGQQNAVGEPGVEKAVADDIHLFHERPERKAGDADDVAPESQAGGKTVLYDAQPVGELIVTVDHVRGAVDQAAAADLHIFRLAQKIDNPAMLDAGRLQGEPFQAHKVGTAELHQVVGGGIDIVESQGHRAGIAALGAEGDGVERIRPGDIVNHQLLVVDPVEHLEAHRPVHAAQFHIVDRAAEIGIRPSAADAEAAC